MFRDFGREMSCHVLGDASAAIGIIRRLGLGKPRHIDTAMLWVQEKNAEKQIAYGKVAGESNMADFMAKALIRDKAEHMLDMMGMRIVKEVDAEALTTRSLKFVGPGAPSMRTLRASPCNPSSTSWT